MGSPSARVNSAGRRCLTKRKRSKSKARGRRSSRVELTGRSLTVTPLSLYQSTYRGRGTTVRQLRKIRIDFRSHDRASPRLASASLKSDSQRRSDSAILRVICVSSPHRGLRNNLKFVDLEEFVSRQCFLLSVMCTRATSGSGIRMTTITVWACVIAVLCSSIVEGARVA